MSVRNLLATLIAAGVLLGCESLPEDLGGASQANYLDIYNEAMTAYQQGDLTTAEPLFEELTRSVPREADPWFRLGNIYARTKRPALAVASYQEAVVRKPELHKAWHNMGVVQLQQAAKSFIELGRRIDEDDPLYPRSQRLTDGVMQLLGADDKALGQ